LIRSKGKINDVGTQSLGYMESNKHMDTKRWQDLWIKHRGEEMGKRIIGILQDMQGRIELLNRSLKSLYYYAYGDTIKVGVPYANPLTHTYLDTLKFPKEKGSYGKWWPDPILEVRTKEPFSGTGRDRENTWHYSLMVPREKATAAFLQKRMQRDLKDHFGYEVTIETRDMPCFYIKAKTKALDILPTKASGSKPQKNKVSIDGKEYYSLKNIDWRELIVRVHSIYGGSKELIRAWGERLPPFINATGIQGKIDIDIPVGIQEVSECQAFLSTLGLYIEKGTAPMKVVVIRDPQS